MLGKRIIPCLDVKDGRVVKGTNFVNLRDAGDPVEVAKIYDAEGADELTFLDITASSDNRGIILDVVAKTAEHVFMPVTVGGGVREVSDIRNLLNSGADKVSINTAAVHNPDFVKAAALKFGSQCTVVAIDAKEVASNKWNIFTHGGRYDTGMDALEWAKEAYNRGAGELLVTSMDADGTKAGFDNILNKKIGELVNIPVIASGGAGTMEHIEEAFTLGNADAALAASIFHFKEIDIMELKRYLRGKNIPVRL